MRRKFLLPALAACAVLAVGAPVASASKAHIASNNTAKAIKFLLKANTNRASEIGGLKDQVTGILTAVKGIHDVLDPIVAAAPQIVSGITALKDGLTALSAAVQGPNIAGQLGAAGTADPGASNTATPSTLPTGTMYRQIVLSSAASGALPAGTPVGIRLWVKMPDVTGLYSNFWACTAAHATGTAQVAGASSYNGDIACPAAN